ncbi:putative prohead core protein [Escherichia phage vB_EcoM-G28]|uniref:Putative prohead core protein n=1 Tax=Escherichia phage vB_EcoM-G28 TaxID=2081604 RepID=A0A3S7GUV7_9CAUD|nr:prohead [Escherichia phage vB_EcoM-G28]AVH85998.1 putative prohead core protein [Escherichia phage vB_EcoM-G28]
MEGLIEAIKSNDLVAARKLFAEAMAARTIDLIKEEKIAIARNFLIEGEEPEDEDEDEDDDEDSDDKDNKKDKDSDEDEDDE